MLWVSVLSFGLVLVSGFGFWFGFGFSFGFGFRFRFWFRVLVSVLISGGVWICLVGIDIGIGIGMVRLGFFDLIRSPGGVCVCVCSAKRAQQYQAVLQLEPEAFDDLAAVRVECDVKQALWQSTREWCERDRGRKAERQKEGQKDTETQGGGHRKFRKRERDRGGRKRDKKRGRKGRPKQKLFELGDVF